MRKYYLIAKNTWDEMVSYRINFSLWRVRMFVGLLIGYFLWNSVMLDSGNLFGYSKELMLTYIVLAPLVYSIVFSTRTQEIADNINSGDLSLFLLKPMGYFRMWFFRDFGDKAMNLAFCVVEFFLFVLLFKPPLFLQTDLVYLGLFFLSLLLAVLLMFFIGSLLSMVGFWSPEVWAPRFIFYVLVSFFAGSLFPLDILPEQVFNVLRLLPFGYLQFFPLKIYLGQLDLQSIFQGFAVTVGWIAATYATLMFIWRKGLKLYSASGR